MERSFQSWCIGEIEVKRIDIKYEKIIDSQQATKIISK